MIYVALLGGCVGIRIDGGLTMRDGRGTGYVRCAVAKDGNGWSMASFGTVYGVTGYMREHQKGVYCVQFKELSRCKKWTQNNRDAGRAF